MTGRPKLGVVQKGVSPTKTVMHPATMCRRMGCVGNTTGICRYSRSTCETVVTNRVITKSVLIVHCRNYGKTPNVGRLVLDVSTLVKLKLSGGIKLVASTHFSKFGCKTVIKRISPRTCSNNIVTLVRGNSRVRVSVTKKAIGLLMSSRVLTREEGS